ncbi:MAG: cytochrome c [Novosphingobium sp.]|uniref:c-type cytochrome n=1 Tax=Novosphingobium sp. TaxID=1874826 RepID=UPI003015FD28
MTRARPMLLTAALAALLAGGAIAAAASPADTIAARQANFKKMGGAMKALKEELAGGADKAKLLAAARTLAATAKLQGGLFPAGTGPSSGVKTDALPAIWAQKPAFDAAAAKLVTEADKLAGIAGSGNAAAVLAQFKAVGGACAACHKQFRAED